MNPKLIIGSIAGISALGSGVAGGYYYFNSEKTIDNTSSEAKTTESLENKAPKREKSLQTGPKPAITSPQSKGPEQINPDPQNSRGSGATTSSTGTGGVAATGVAAPKAESASGPTVLPNTLNSGGSVSQSPDVSQASRT